MTLYGGIDLHGNNNVIALIDEEDRVVFQKRIANEMETILFYLEPYREEIVGLAVESTYNWYWLVDGLMVAGYKTHLANPAAMKQYEGLKHTDDKTDARWIAHMLRLGILPQGYIYPKKDRPIGSAIKRKRERKRPLSSTN